ncbi:MAG TPA: sel1 repeat family protein [Epsilonproteobacteria bacterium]|nr:sel1 repeat family protein [Campylobacterota bacterium]
MNQTKKRLSIINLAISITDIETIQLQILKLALLKTDEKIQKIIAVLQAENYAQAQGLITAYIEAPAEDIVQRTSQKGASVNISASDQAIIDEFELFVTPSNTSNAPQTMEININDYESQRPKYVKPKHEIDFDAILSLDSEDVLPDNIDIDISNKTKEDSFFTPEDKEASLLDIPTNDIPKDSFFDEEEISDEILQIVKTEPVVTPAKKESKEEIETSIDLPKETKETPIQEIKVESKEIPSSYPAMPHISQKFIRMKKEYPPIQKTYEKFDTVETLLTKISQEGYTEQEMEEMLAFIKKLIETSKYTEASQLLLICGATESKFAQFMFARALYTGSVLTKNINEAFTLMNALSTEDYPEALCDLGQFYEHGIGTTKDTMKAESLYKEAVSLGIKRATKHYDRLKKQNRRLFKK